MLLHFINHIEIMMLIGKLQWFLNKSLKFMVDMKLSMLVIYWFYIVGQGAYGIVVAAKDKLASDKTK